MNFILDFMSLFFQNLDVKKLKNIQATLKLKKVAYFCEI